MHVGSLNLSPPPGFQGLNPDRPVTRYIRHLPHWRQDGATYFVTFRLADSLPKEKLRELRRVKEEWERKHPHPRGDAEWEILSRATMRRVEYWLDQGFGSCPLADAEAASEIVESVRYFDNGRYELDSYVVMAPPRMGTAWVEIRARLRFIAPHRRLARRSRMDLRSVLPATDQRSILLFVTNWKSILQFMADWKSLLR